ncbi:hypothetical protein LIA77_03944 [Sarocladium implicatum]|nr:hypothetical protein LIA77_03944 [Sarocladium implicatum]
MASDPHAAVMAQSSPGPLSCHPFSHLIGLYGGHTVSALILVAIDFDFDTATLASPLGSTRDPRFKRVLCSHRLVSSASRPSDREEGVCLVACAVDDAILGENRALACSHWLIVRQPQRTIMPSSANPAAAGSCRSLMSGHRIAVACASWRPSPVDVPSRHQMPQRQPLALAHYRQITSPQNADLSYPCQPSSLRVNAGRPLENLPHRFSRKC